MPDAPLFARAWPERLSVTETYAYEQKISSTPEIQESEPPSGVIEVRVPYDGGQSFGPEAGADIEAQRKRRRGSRADDHAVVGHLALAAHGTTDLGRRLGLTAEHGSWPVAVPIPWTGDDGRAKALDDRRECRVSARYTPAAPQVNPLTLDFVLRDDDTPADPDTEWGQIQGRMLMGLRLRATLPEGWSRVPVVKQLTLRWPCSPSLDRLHFGVGSLDRQPNAAATCVGYDAVDGSMYWREVPGGWGDHRGRLQRWNSRLMILALQRLGDLAGRVELRGEAVVELPGLLSGTQAAWYGATGRRRARASADPSDLPETTTLLRLSFEINLDDALSRRERVARQRLHFDELLPDDANRGVIFRALGDLGFNSVHGAPTGSMGLPAIVAERSVAGEILKLKVAIDGRTFQVTRVIQRANGVTETVQIDSGDVTVEVTGGGEFHGDAPELIRTMNAVHQRLHERFSRTQTSR